MFIYLSRKNSQKINKSVDLDSSLAIAKYAPSTYQNLSHFTVNDQEQVLSFAVNPLTSITDEANITPAIVDSHVSAEKSCKNIVIGNLAGDVGFTQLLPVAENCTDLVDKVTNLAHLFDNSAGQCFAQLDSQFVLFAWHQQNNQLHIAKDPFNPKSIFWAELADGVLVSTDIQFISKMLHKPLLLSEAGLASWLSGYPNPAISLFQDIHVLPIGHRLQVDSELNVQSIAFWDIDPEHKIHYNTQQEYADHFLQGLSASVAQASATDADVLVSQMSGGMDSTSITAIANKQAKHNNKQVLPLSHMYKNSEKCDEEQLVQDMLSSLNIQHSIQMAVDEGADRNFLALYPSHLESPGTVLSPRYIRELALVKQAGANVMLSGNGGDEMCWGHSLAYTQRLREGDFAVVPEVLKACPALGMPRLKTLSNLFVKPFLPEMILKALGAQAKPEHTFNTPVWLTDKAQELAYNETKVANPFDLKKDPVGYNRYLSIKTTSTYNAMRSYDKLADDFGISVRHPFFNTTVAEFSFAVPMKQLIQGPYPKWLLRYSMQNDLPKSVCWNLQKTTFDQHFGNLVRENASQIREILEDERLADMGLVNQSLLLAEFDRVVANPSIPLQVDLLYAILTFSWLRAVRAD
ncbi:asparagine synthetase B family protein [Paraglaciecola sp. L3A3]|uniref:asparagine synthase-related protein n=1 Tax=Paraglaciecola sp. L3A3 TaxID=2686358 RepID=UPI00131BB5EA|nr:asparagine synthetase B family protein [Paraglaciecola sp. L3A3]